MLSLNTHQVGYDEWEIVTPEHLFQSVVPGREYRIKQEEHQLKVGDCVRDIRNNNVFQINSVNFNLNLSITNGVYIHWQPKPGELVILKNKNDILSIIKYNGETNVYPFIGEITWLHKKD